MNKSRGEKQHITLGDDGELYQRLTDPAYRDDAIFCIHCAAPNYPGAKFCNECGGSLIEQQADEQEKRKHNQAYPARPTHQVLRPLDADFVPLPDELSGKGRTRDGKDGDAIPGMTVVVLVFLLVAALFQTTGYFPPSICVVGAIAIVVISIATISG